jgi:tetratricopeptide (TPR) repeat protein
LSLLEAIAEMASEDLHTSLARLQAAQLLHETRLFPEHEYAFAHALTQEVAYGSLLQDRRRALHARILAAMEASHPDRLPEQMDVLAHHALRAERWEKAVTYLRQAGARAAAHSAHREAVGRFEQALSALAQLQESRETAEQALAVRLELRNSLQPLGDLRAAAGHLREAERLAATLGDSRRLGWTQAYMSQYLWTTGDSAAAAPFAQKALGAGENAGDTGLRVAAGIYLAFISHTLGDLRRAQTVLEQVLHALERESAREAFGANEDPAVLARCYLAWCLAERGAFDAGLAEGQTGLRAAEAANHPYSLITACWGLSHLYVIKGEADRAERCLERSLAICRESGITYMLPFLDWRLGCARTLAGRGAEGVLLLEQAAKGFEAIGFHAHDALLTVHLGEALLRAGSCAAALGSAERGLALARAHGQRGWEAGALCLSGEIAAQQEPIPGGPAEDYYRQALAVAEELGMRPLAGHCWLGLGALHRRAGRWPEALECLTTAAALYRTMDMGLWLGRVEAELEKLS